MLPQAPQRDLSDERDRLRLLLDVNNAVVSNLSLKDLLYAVSGWLRKLIPFDFASMVIKDEETGMLKIHALDVPAPGGVLGEGSVLPLEGTPPGIAIATRQTVMRDRIDFNEFFSPIIREAYNAGLRCGISVPLICHDQVVGTINVGSLSEAAFTQKDAELLEQIAGQVAIAVQNALNFERAERALRELTALKTSWSARSSTSKRRSKPSTTSKRSSARAQHSRRSCNNSGTSRTCRRKHALRMNKRIDKIPRDTVDTLCSYPWPGNVRELENFMERSVILSSGSELQAPLGELKLTTSAPVAAVAQPANGPRSLEDVERQHIVETLEQTRGVIGGKGGAAEILGLPTSTLRNRMKKLGLK